MRRLAAGLRYVSERLEAMVRNRIPDTAQMAG